MRWMVAVGVRLAIRQVSAPCEAGTPRSRASCHQPSALQMVKAPRWGRKVGRSSALSTPFSSTILTLFISSRSLRSRSFPSRRYQYRSYFRFNFLNTQHEDHFLISTPMRSKMGNAPPSNGEKQKYKMKPAQNLPLTEKCQHYTDKNDVPPEIQKCVFCLVYPCVLLLTPLRADTGHNGTLSSPPTTTVSL